MPKPRVRTNKTREDFIDHIQRVEAYAKGADLTEVEADELPDRLQDPGAAAHAKRIWDVFHADDDQVSNR